MTQLRFGPRVDPIDEANTKVPVVDVLRRYGQFPDLENSTSMKFYCVWFDLHPDSGSSMRLYADSNHAYCFAGCGVITPVRLHADVRRIGQRQAARELLDLFNIRPMTWRERLANLEDPQGPFTQASKAAWAQALVTYVSSKHPHGEEYDPAVTDQMREAMAQLDQLDNDHLQFQEWLSAWKAVL